LGIWYCILVNQPVAVPLLEANHQGVNKTPCLEKALGTTREQRIYVNIALFT